MSTRGDVLLRRDIGTLGASLLVLNGLIGAGIFALPSRVALNAGLLSPWLFLAVGLIFIPVVLSFAALASYYDDSGGPVLYARQAFGDGAGFATGWLLFVSRSAAFSANATVMAAYLGAIVPTLGGELGRAGVILAATACLTWANVRGVRSGVAAMLVLTILKLSPLLVLIAVGLGRADMVDLLPELSEPVRNLGPTTLLMVYAFVGFETIGVTAGETSEPRRRLPGALLRTVFSISVFYFLVALTFVAVIPAEAYAGKTLVDVGRTLGGALGAVGITIAAVFSIGGNMASSMLAAPRLLYALAQHRMMPTRLGAVHPRYRTPHIAILVMAVLCVSLALSGTFTALAIASTLSRLLAYLLCIGALPRVQAAATYADRQQAFKLPGGWLIPGTALLICSVLITQTTLANWIAVGLLLVIGLLFFAVARLRG